MRIHKCPCFFFQLAVMFYWRKSRALLTAGVCVYRGLHFTVPNCINNPATSHSQRHNHAIFGTSHMKTQVLIFFLDVFFLRQSLREKNNHGIEMSLWLRVLVDKILLLRLYFCGVSSLTNMDISLAAAINELSNTSSEFFFSLEALWILAGLEVIECFLLF